jgi:glucosamine-6-phosphate deaminase
MIVVSQTTEELAARAAEHAAESLRRQLAKETKVRLLAATGASQLEFLKRLVRLPDIDWKRVELFHLDEYVGLDESHPASFARYIRERIVQPTGIPTFHLLDGRHAKESIAQANLEFGKGLIDLALVGVGENAHLAFNDPPADFDTSEAYMVVQLDEACRNQQVGEGWFSSFDEVPKQAITLSVPAILKSREILVVVPDRRKAKAIAATLDGPITPDVPASALQTHGSVTFYLDSESASELATIPPTPSASSPASL